MACHLTYVFTYFQLHHWEYNSKEFWGIFIFQETIFEAHGWENKLSYSELNAQNHNSSFNCKLNEHILASLNNTFQHFHTYGHI